MLGPPVQGFKAGTEMDPASGKGFTRTGKEGLESRRDGCCRRRKGSMVSELHLNETQVCLLIAPRPFLDKGLPLISMQHDTGLPIVFSV